MPRAIKPATAYHVAKIRDAQNFLKLALANARRAESPRLVAAIRRAMKSADGARRHADRRKTAGGRSDV